MLKGITQINDLNLIVINIVLEVLASAIQQEKVKQNIGKRRNKTPFLSQTKRNRKMVVARSWGMGEWGDVSQRTQTSIYKMSKFWGLTFSTGTIINNSTVLYI